MRVDLSDPDLLKGLGRAEAAARLARFGPNVLHRARSRGFGDILRGTLREPMFLFLIAAASLYLVVGDFGEGLFLLGGATVSIGLVIYQEARSERALAALRELAEPFVRVIRDGREEKIRARDIVPGDIALIGEGERLAFDGVLVAGDVLTVDESTLTGESVPVSKHTATNLADATDAIRPGGDHTPFLFAGTLNTRGQGVGLVTATGPSTQLGRIGASLASIEQGPTPLQQTSTRIIGWLGLVAVAFCAVVTIAHGVFRGDWFEGVLAGITLAISLLPEEFPMVLAIFMAFGSWRLARDNVLVRRSAVLETLGAATMLCVDKTGTLTENRMTIATIWADGEFIELGDALPRGKKDTDLIAAAALASPLRPIDPMDRAVRRLASELAIEAAPGGAPIGAHPLRPDLLAVIQAWTEDGDTTMVAAKGAPEAIFELCGMDPGARATMHRIAEQMAARGQRVLGVASRRHAGPPRGDLAARSFTFQGLVGFLDPVRADVPEALATAREAGIDVTMITGDLPATAREIALRCGIDVTAGVITGPRIAAMSEDQLRECAKTTRVFARVQPEQKLALVRAFRANGQVVAMTGDGVNDAPALEAAHIGIAMGARGTDVAREAADLVLLDDSFASIVGGVRLGRRIFANLRKALTYIAAIHVPVAGLALFPIVFGLPPMLFPMHVVLLELVIDPVCSLVFESEPSERDAMKRPPRPPDESLFGARVLMFGLLQGAIILAAILCLYAGSLAYGLPAPQARAAAFVALIAANLVLAFADSAEAGTSFLDRRRMPFWAITGAATAIVIVILLVPWISRTFAIAPPPPSVLAIALAVALITGGWYGLLRRIGLVGRIESIRSPRGSGAASRG